MGVWEFLTKKRYFGSVVFDWKEPCFYRCRLQGDLGTRLAVVLGLWAAASGLMLFYSAFNTQPYDVILALFFGVMLGLGPGFLYVLNRRHLTGGSITIKPDEILRLRSYVSLWNIGGWWEEWSTWPLGAIERCVVVPAQSLKQSFSVLQLYAAGQWDILGVPASVELKKLLEHLVRQGVPVTLAEDVRPEFKRPLHVAAAIAVLPMALVLFVSGLGFYVLTAEPVDEGRRDLRIADMPPRPQFDHGAPRAPRDPFGSQPAAPGLVPPSVDAPVASEPRLPSTPHPKFEMPRFTPSPRNLAPWGSSTGGKQTELIGGSGGAPFERSSSTGQPVVGVRYRLGSWAGRECVGRLEPIFASGAASAAPDVVMARDGYALGALEVDADQYVDAVALVFKRLTPEGDLDPSDSYTSDWIGNPTGKPTRAVGGGGAKVIGICGRGAAVLDAIGLVIDPYQ